MKVHRSKSVRSESNNQRKSDNLIDVVDTCFKKAVEMFYSSVLSTDIQSYTKFIPLLQMRMGF